MTLLPKEIFNQHVAVLGKTGAGKSSALRFCVEQLLDDQQPVCIVDPKGDWWGLKSSKSGKEAGYPVVIFGGDHADVPLNAHAGNHVAELVATGNRPCILDLGGWMVADRTRFFIDFASTLFRSSRGRRILVIDEVHNFAPQGKVLDPAAGKMLHWTNRLASEGRGKGLTILSASQRPQKVHKDFLTCAETLLAMRVIHNLDRGAIKDWIDGCGNAAKGKEVLATLADMDRGEAWAWSPEIKFGPKRIKFPMFKTYDSFAPQGHAAAKLKGWAEVDLAEVRTKLAAVVEEAKANDPAELKKQVAELRKQLAAKQPPAKPVESTSPSQVAFAKAIRDWKRNIEPHMERIERSVESLRKTIAEVNRHLVVNGDREKAIIAARSDRANVVDVINRSPQKPVPATTPKPSSAVRRSGLKTSPGQRILNALAWWEGIGVDNPSRMQIGIIAKVNASGGYFDNVIGPLVTEALVERGSGTARLTSEGRTKAEAPEAVYSLAEYHALIRAQIKSGPSIRMFDALCEHGMSEITREELGAASNVNPGGGYFDNTIGPLATLGLVDRRQGKVTPTELMFPESLVQ